MNFEYSEDQQVFKDSVIKYLQDQYDFEKRQSIVKSDEAFDQNIWAQTAELGWLYMPFSEEQGGFDGSAVDTILFFEQFGKHLVVEPYLETLVLTGGVLRRVENNLSEQYLSRLMVGELQGAVAHFEAQSRGDLTRISTSAVGQGEGYVLNGKKAVVYNAPEAQLLIVSALLPDDRGMGLFLVEADVEGLVLQSYPTVDGRVAADICLQGVMAPSASLLAEGDQAASILEDIYNEALLALTAEMVGAMDVLLQTTVDYTKERKQFGAPISKFQVLQHCMVDMYMAAELARSLMYAAAIKMRDGDSDASAFVSAAKAKADKCAKQVAHSAVQLHGGIATTEELNVGHYLKRITVAANLFGSTQYHLQRYQRLTKAKN